MNLRISDNLIVSHRLKESPPSAWGWTKSNAAKPCRMRRLNGNCRHGWQPNLGYGRKQTSWSAWWPPMPSWPNPPQIRVLPWLHRFFSEVRIHPAPCFRALLSVPSVSSCSKTAFFRVFRVFRGFKPQPLIPESFATDQARISHFLVWATRPQDDACGGRRCILTLTPYRRFPNRLDRRFPNRQSEDSS